MNEALPPLTQEYERLLKPLTRIAFRLALNLTRNREEAEDLVQEAAIQAFRAFGGYQPGTHFKAWFLRILTNLFLNRVRKQQREAPVMSLDEAPDLFLYKQVEMAGWTRNNGDPAKQVMDRIGTDQIIAAIGGLPDEFRVVAALYFVDELPYAEIAGILECPIGTVRSRLHRGRKLLQKALWDALGEGSDQTGPPVRRKANDAADN